MLLKAAAALPSGEQWCYELKFDGFRGLAIKDNDHVRLFSRNGRDLSKRFLRIVDAVRKLRVRSAILDGEIVCLDDLGRPCFEDLQSFSSKLESNLFFYAFDLLAVNGQSLIGEKLEERKNRLGKLVPKSGALRLSDTIDASPEDLTAFAIENRLEGIVAKRTGSLYEPGKRTGTWAKFKTYQHAEFVIGGFLPTTAGIESLAVGFFRDGKFIYAARVENYLRGANLAELQNQLSRQRPASRCAFERVPIKKHGDTWSAGLTSEDAARFVWLTPKIKVLVRFTEWTRAGVLRHAGLKKVG